ncbi:MAG TPA: glycerophosphodiester phosphodiesterase family protein [Thermoleophilaceae bacterium]|nr:glycerophosphodiester phosphodiesterase family protein [Thermoleophilaceae bacterium]
MLRLAAVTLALTLTCAATAYAQGTNRWIEERAPLNIAHQGGEDEFPSNTMYAFRKALQAGADMLELDVGVTKDNKVVVLHDTTVDRTTNGRGTVASKTLWQIKRLDGAYWFAPRARDHYSHDLPRRAYRFRGIATGRAEPPTGFKAADFRVPTLKQVSKAFPRTPINVEIKGRTPDEATEEYVRNAEVLARLLRKTKRRNLIVASFQQAAVDRFHELVPRIDVAPGIAGAANWLLAGGSPGPGVAAFQLPITFEQAGTTLEITTAENVARAHREGYAWHNWFSGEDRDAPATWRRLIDMCVDGIMTSRSRALERVLRRHERPASCG